MKKVLSVILSFVLALSMVVCIPASCAAKTDKKTYKGYTYCELSDKTVKILMHEDQKETEINIPSEIKGKKVVEIGSMAFFLHPFLEKITIPDTVKKIGENAFYECFDLNNVIVPDSVTSIGDYAFYDCEELSNIKLSKNLKKIGQSILIGTAYFNNNKNWTGDVLYYGKYLLTAGGSVKGNCKIKDGTKIIADGAFDNEDEMTSITLPSSLKVIGEGAFLCCYSLKKISIPKNVKEISEYMFKDCDSLEKVTLTDSITKIGSHAFYNCPALKKVNVPASVTKIGSCAFGLQDKGNPVVGTKKVKNFVLKGYKNSAAESYAKKSGIKFSAKALKRPEVQISSGKGMIKVKYTPKSNSTGFQVKYTKGKKTTIKNYETEKAVTKTVKKLKKGKYTVQVRSYDKKGSKTAYSIWTDAKKVNVK